MKYICGFDGVMVRVPDCHTQVCGFKPGRSREFLRAKNKIKK